MSTEIKSVDVDSQSFAISVRDGVRCIVIFVVASAIILKISLTCLSLERVDLPRVEVDDPSAPVVLDESTRMQTYERHNEFLNQVDSSFALKMCNSSIDELRARKAEISAIVARLPEDDYDRFEHNFEIAFINVELTKRLKALMTE